MPHIHAYTRCWHELVTIQCVLYRKSHVFGEDRLRIVLPASIRQEVFKALHDDLGHQGRDRTVSFFKERFYWPGMDEDIAEMERKCHRCMCRETRPARESLVPIQSFYPMEVICIDYLSLERSKGGVEDFESHLW